jgi:hypothetical protein
MKRSDVKTGINSLSPQEQAKLWEDIKKALG